MEMRERIKKISLDKDFLHSIVGLNITLVLLAIDYLTHNYIP